MQHRKIRFSFASVSVLFAILVLGVGLVWASPLLDGDTYLPLIIRDYPSPTPTNTPTSHAYTHTNAHSYPHSDTDSDQPAVTDRQPGLRAGPNRLDLPSPTRAIQSSCPRLPIRGASRRPWATAITTASPRSPSSSPFPSTSTTCSTGSTSSRQSFAPAGSITSPYMSTRSSSPRSTSATP